MIAQNCSANSDSHSPSPSSSDTAGRPWGAGLRSSPAPTCGTSVERVVLGVQISQYLSATVLKFTGPANLDNMRTVYRHFIRLAIASPKRTVLDMSELSFICSQAIGQVVSLQRLLRRYGEQLVIVGPNEHILGLLRILRLDRTMTIVPTLSEALAR